MHSAVTATFAKTVVLRKNSVANGHESITNRWNVHVHACIYATHCQSGSDSAARGVQKKVFTGTGICLLFASMWKGGNAAC